jgi:hypothetical protein
MLDAIRSVKELAPQARLDCCPYESGEDGTGFFIRIGAAGHWLSKVRKTPRAAWANAAQRLRAKSPTELSLGTGSNG